MSELHPATQLLLWSGFGLFWLIPLSSWLMLTRHRNKNANIWFGGTFAYAMAASAFVLGRALPQGWSALLAGGFSALAVLMLAESMRREVHQRPPPFRVYGALMLLDIAIFVWALDTPARIDLARAVHLTIASGVEVYLLRMCWLTVQKTGSRALRVVMATFSAYIIINLTRAVKYLTTQEYDGLLVDTWSSNIALLVNYLSVVFYSFGYWGFVMEKALHAEAKAHAEVLVERERLRLFEQREKLNRKHASERAAITERLILTGKLAQSNALTSYIAHEINQPLAAMQLDLETAQFMMDERGYDPDVQRRLSNRVLGEVRRVADIVRRLRQMFISVEPVQQAVSLDEVVKTVAHMMSQKLDKGQVQVKLDLHSGDQLTTAYGELEHVIINLFQQALDAFDGGEPGNRDIHIRTWRDGATVVLRFASNTTQTFINPRSTDVFAITPPTETEGASLGLWLARHIVNKLGGRMRVDDTDTEGTALIVTLPIAQP